MKYWYYNSDINHVIFRMQVFSFNKIYFIYSVKITTEYLRGHLLTCQE